MRGSRPPRGGLWQHHDFRQLWAAQAISQLGSQVTFVALPLIAALLLDASATDLGLLAAAGSLPAAALALVAGVWVDRLPRKPIMIVTDLLRGLALATIPLAWLLDVLSFGQLVVVQLVAGSLTVFFNVANRAYLPTLVSRDEITEGNAKLETTNSAAVIAGPALGGGLVALASAPLALALDAVSYLVSAAFLMRIGARETPLPRHDRRAFRGEVAEGLRLAFGNPVLRAITACSATWAFFDTVLLAVLVLFITRELGLGAGIVGIVYSAVGVGLLAGALLVARVERRVGTGRAVIVGATLSSLGGAFDALAMGPAPAASAALVTGQFLLGMGGSMFFVAAMTVRVALTPPGALGRVGSTLAFATGVLGPLGYLTGGVLGDAIGLRAAFVVGALGGVVGFLWVLASPLRHMHDLPTVADGGPGPRVQHLSA